jgi:hypothetical protein
MAGFMRPVPADGGKPVPIPMASLGIYRISPIRVIISLTVGLQTGIASPKQPPAASCGSKSTFL